MNYQEYDASLLLESLTDCAFKTKMGGGHFVRKITDDDHGAHFNGGSSLELAGSLLAVGDELMVPLQDIILQESHYDLTVIFKTSNKVTLIDLVFSV
jgi:hypothetical protein